MNQIYSNLAMYSIEQVLKSVDSVQSRISTLLHYRGLPLYFGSNDT